MAKIFKITEDKEDNEFDDGVDEIIVVDDEDEFKEMIFWFLENDIQYHFAPNETDDYAFIALKDDNVMAFKLRWA